MKQLIYFLIVCIPLTIASCLKGKKMPETVYVYVDETDTDFLSAAGIGSLSGEPFSYTWLVSAAGERQQFKENMEKFLAKNNCEATSPGNAQYTIKLEVLTFYENSFAKTYWDTCAYSSPLSYHVPMLRVNYSAKATIYRKGATSPFRTLEVNETHKEKLSTEAGCGSPGVNRVHIKSLRKRLAKRLRKEVTNTIYIDMGFNRTGFDLMWLIKKSVQIMRLLKMHYFCRQK